MGGGEIHDGDAF